MSKRRIYYQHLHFKGSKQGLSWETQFHDTPTTQSLGQRHFGHAHSCTHRHRYTYVLHTHTHQCTHFQSLPSPVLCPSFSLSLNSHIFCHSSFSFNKRRPWFALFWHLSSSQLLMFFSLFFFSFVFPLLFWQTPSFWSCEAVSLWTKVLIASLSSYIMVFFVINSSTFYLPSPFFFCRGSATGCLVVVIYPCTVPVELNLYSPWDWNSSVHGLISALKDCRAAVITPACLPVIGLIKRLTDDSWLSYPVTVEEGGKKGESRNKVAWPVNFGASLETAGSLIDFHVQEKKRQRL